MACLTFKTGHNDFISRLENRDATIARFFAYDPMDEESYKTRLNRPSNGREQQLARIIEDQMTGHSISQAQRNALKQLAEGAKVVIGGQQAGLFGGPLYTFHKIFSIITQARTLTETYGQPVVPVFWIAGEDHDFDEVQHAYVYNKSAYQLNKVKYHTLHPPETSVSRFVPDREEMENALTQLFQNLSETPHTKKLYAMCQQIIAQSNSWTDTFRGILQYVFSAYGVLFIDAHDPALRAFERPMLRQMIERHDDIDRAFRETQTATTQAGLDKMIQTDTNVHIFLEEDDMRQLLRVEGERFYLPKSDKYYSRNALLALLESSPERFSNNVVTRPVMEEWLFNTVNFIGGPSEIKYWAELKGVFDVLDVEMPIVIPRMRMTYVDGKISKLCARYGIDVQQAITSGVASERTRFIRAQASETFLSRVEEMKAAQTQLYEDLMHEVAGDVMQEKLVKKNDQIHQRQYDYLVQRYLLNIERENELSMDHFKAITHTLHPMEGLQERVWHPLQIMNDFGTDVFSPSTYPPLRYTFDQIVIEI